MFDPPVVLPDRVLRRVDELMASVEVTDPHRTRAALVRLLESLAAEEHAPTPIRDPSEAVDVHVADSLAGLRVPEVREATQIADLGSGVGYPGVVLAAALPRARVVLIESVERKADWLRRSAAAAGLGNIEVLADRAESVGAGSRRFDVVTARAVAALPVLAEYAAPLLLQGGTLVAWKGTPSADEVSAGSRAAAEVGMERIEPIETEPYPGSGRRTLQRFRKIAPTPERFPRRPGMASKRPLGR